MIGINAIAALSAKFINMFIVLWAQHRLLKDLSPDEFSIYPLIAILIYFLPLITTSFTSPAQRFVTGAFAKNKREEITEVVSTIVSILLFPLTFIAIGGTALLFWLDSAFEISAENLGTARLMFGMILVASALKLLMQPFCVAFYAQQRLVRFHGVSLVGELIRLASLLTLFWVFGAQVIWVVATDAIVSTCVVAALAFWSTRMMPEIRFRPSAVKWSRLREFMSFGIFDVGISFSRMMRTSLPIWLLNLYDTAIAVNTFHIGQSAFRQAQKAWIPMRGTLGPPMIGMATTGQTQRLQRTFYKGGRIAIWLTMMVCTPLIVFNREVTYLYAGDEYVWAGPVMAVLLLRYPLQLMNAFFPQLARAKAVPEKASVPMIICELTTALFMAIAIIGFKYSVMGVAVCSLIVTAVFELFILAPIANRLMGGSIQRSLFESLLPGLMPAIAAALVMLATQSLLQPATLWEVAFASIPGILIYLMVLWICFRPDDRKYDLNAVSVVRNKLKPAPTNG